MTLLNLTWLDIDIPSTCIARLACSLVFKWNEKIVLIYRRVNILQTLICGQRYWIIFPPELDQSVFFKGLNLSTVGRHFYGILFMDRYYVSINFILFFDRKVIQVDTILLI